MILMFSDASPRFPLQLVLLLLLLLPPPSHCLFEECLPLGGLHSLTFTHSLVVLAFPYLFLALVGTAGSADALV